MQPLNTRVSPRSLSTIGCLPRAHRSMIDRRRWPNASGPCAPTPAESGPRDAMAPVIRVTAATSADRPSKRISPQIPHMLPSVPYGAAWSCWPPVKIQVSLLPRPEDEFTMRDPRAATRVSPAGMTCAVTVSSGPGRRCTNARRAAWCGDIPSPSNVGGRADSPSGECRVSGQRDRLLGDVTLRLGLQLATAGLQHICGGFRSDHHAGTAVPVDRFDHQLGDVVQHVITLRAFGADPRRHLRQSRLLTEVVLDHRGYVRVNGLVVGDAVAQRVGNGQRPARDRLEQTGPQRAGV